MKEADHFHPDGSKLILIMDGYTCHVSYKTPSLLRDNRIVVSGLPEHTSYAIQPLDVSIVGPLKEFLRHLNVRTITTKRSDRNDIFTV